MGSSDKRIPCRKDTRDQVRRLKRGGDSYEDVLQHLLETYNGPRADT